MKKLKFFIYTLIWCSVCHVPLYAQDFQRGLEYLKNNFPEKALPLFYAETEKSNGNKKAYLYLSVACIQLQKYSDAIVWLQKGMVLDPTEKHLYSYNLGNAYYMQGAYDLAISAYEAALTENMYYAPAILNKANAEMQLAKYDDALVSYKKYLSLEPQAQQRMAIQQIIALLQGEKDAAVAEQLRKEAEEKARIEREKALLDKVNSDLNSDGSQSISAGSEDTIDYTEEEGSLE